MKAASLLLVALVLVGCGEKSSPQPPEFVMQNEQTGPNSENESFGDTGPDAIVSHHQREEKIVDKKLIVRPLGRAAQLADKLMVPIMYLAAGTFREASQQTHFWNNTKLQPQDIAYLRLGHMAHCEGMPDAHPRRTYWIPLPLFHIPIFGGWRKYAVLEPVGYEDEWHIGWNAGGSVGVSRIPLRGPVRMLIGPGDVSFFGVTAGETGGDQIPIRQIGSGRIGDGGLHAQVPLL